MSQHFGDKGDATIFNPPAPNSQTMPSIKTLIKQARFKEALDVLENLVPDYLQNDLILLYSRITTLENQVNREVISTENAGIETAKIRAAILSIFEAAGIQDLPDEDPKTSPNISTTGRDTGGFGSEVEPVEIPAIEPLTESLLVPKGEDGKTKILFLTANPADQKNLAVDRESKLVLVDAQGKALDIKICPNIDKASMNKMVAFEKPQIVHFSGHGSDGSLAMIDAKTNNTAPLSNNDLVRIFTLFKKAGVKCVVLCSCWSFNQAKVISELELPVVGMLRRIADEEAIQFSRELYYLLVSDNPLEVIFEFAKDSVSESSREIPSLWYNGKRIA